MAGPLGVALDSQGDLFIADTDNNVIRKVTPVPSITNVQPSSGTVQGGGTTKITWSSTSISGGVDVLLSTDGGSTFTPIATNVPDAGLYGWSVPADLSTTTAEIRIVDHNNASVLGTSAATFTISKPTTPIISIVAGTYGGGGYSGDGGPAVGSELSATNDVVVDSQGDLFIADTGNQVIREVNGLTGVITTIAGNGTLGFSGDGGPATSAMLAVPTGVALDGKGDLFIADENNNRIREVNLSTGVITTVAGNGTAGFSGDGQQAASAELNAPFGVAVDSQGHLFIGDAGNDRIREVNLTTGVISTVAGNGTYGFSGDSGPASAAELNIPEGVAVDSQGDLYIADSSNHRIREVIAAGGAITPSSVITTVAGNGTRGYSGDGGPATSAELKFPKGVAVDSQGDLFIGDTSNGVIREVNAAGVISTYAGNHTGGSTPENVPATSAEFDFPVGVAVDSHGNLFIADDDNRLVERVTPVPAITDVQPSSGTVQGGGTTKITWSSTTLAGGVDILLSTDGGSTFTPIASNVPNAGVYAWSVPADLSTTTAEIRVVDHNNASVLGTSAGTFSISLPTAPIISTVAGTGTSGNSGNGGPAILAQFGHSNAIAVDAQGDIFFSDNTNSVVREVNGLMGVITTVAGNGGMGHTGDGGQATNAGLADPVGVAVDDKGRLFIAEFEGDTVREVNLATGVITTVAGNGQYGSTGDGGPATSAELESASGLAVDSQGNLFIVDQGDNAVREVNLSTARSAPWPASWVRAAAVATAARRPAPC